MSDDPLFSLVKSLKKGEKRFFRLFSQRHTLGGKNNYLDLYDSLSQLEVYREPDFREQFKGAPFLRDLTTERHYLRESILKAMRQFHAGSRVQYRVQELIQDADFLERKGFYRESQRVLRKAKKLARKFELFTAHLEILMWERRLLKQNVLADQWGTLTELLEERDEILERLTQFESIMDCHDQLMILSRQSGGMSVKVRQERTQPLLQKLNAMRLPGGYTEILYYYARWLALALEGDFRSAWEDLKAARAIFEAHPHFIREWPTRYKLFLSNMLACCHYLDQYDHIPQLVEEVRALPAGNFDEAAETFQNVTFFEMLYFLNTGKFEEGLQEVAAVKAGLEKYGEKINHSRALSISINLALLHLITGRTKEGLVWTQRILNSQLSEHRRDIQAFARVLTLMLHWERGNMDVVETQLRNFRNQLQRMKEWTWFEQVAMRAFREEVKWGGTGAKGQGWQAVLEELKAASVSRTGYVEFQLWLTSKLEKRPLSEVLRSLGEDSP